MLFSALFVSCVSVQKISVKGTEGTKIYNPESKYLGTIDADGSMDIELPGGEYYPFLLSKAPGSNLIVPFALDYIEKNYTGKITFGALSIVAVSEGAVFLPLSFLFENPIPSLAVSGAVLGLGIWGLATCGKYFFSNHIPSSFSYEYLSEHRLNSDMTFTKPVFNEPEKTLTSVKKLETSVSSSSSVSKRQLSQKTNRTLNDYGKQLEGSYKGSGALTLNGENIETYTDIVIKLVRADRAMVSVNVVESNGNSYFESTSDYTIKKGNDETFVLTHASISDATIVIDKDSNLVYKHPKVDIEGGIYTLSIKANKQ